MMTASGVFGDEVMAVEMSVALRGEPVIIVRPGVEVSEEALRTKAVTVCEFWRAVCRIKDPVRPVAPRRRICIFRKGGWCDILDF
jgi:hypothetical protein